MSGEGDALGDARFQTISADCEEEHENEVEPNDPEMKMAGLQSVVSDQAKVECINQEGGRNKPIAKPRPGEALRAAVIFGHGLEGNAPPEVTVNLDVPFVPARVGGIT